MGALNLLLFGSVLLGNVLPALSGEHSLQYIYTALSKPLNLPGIYEFIALGMLDDRELDYYNSVNQVKVPMQSWMKEKMQVDYWEKGTQSRKSKEQWFKVNVGILMDRMRHNKSDLHVLQWRHGCVIDEDTNGHLTYLKGIDEYSYDGSEFLSFDEVNSRWIAPVHAAEETKRKWDEVAILNQYTKSYLEKECVNWLSKFMDYGKEELRNHSSPDVHIFMRKSITDPNKMTLTCMATGFYPKDVEVSVRKSRTSLPEHMLTSSGVRPNGDGTYQLRKSVDIYEKDKHLYECYVMHSTLKEPIIKGGNEDIPCQQCSPVLPGIIGGVIGVVVSLAVVGGVCGLLFMKGLIKMRSRTSLNSSSAGNLGDIEQENGQSVETIPINQTPEADHLDTPSNNGGSTSKKNQSDSGNDSGHDSNHSSPEGSQEAVNEKTPMMQSGGGRCCTASRNWHASLGLCRAFFTGHAAGVKLMGDEQQENMQCLIETTPNIPRPESNNSDTPSNNSVSTSKTNQSDSGNDSGHDSKRTSPEGSQEAVNKKTPMMQSEGDVQQAKMQCPIKTTPVIPRTESNNSDTPSNNGGSTSKTNQSDSGSDSDHDSNHSSPAGSQEAVNEETPMIQSEGDVQQAKMQCPIKTTPIIPRAESNNSDTPSKNSGSTSKKNQSDSGSDSGHDSKRSSPAGSQDAVNEKTPMMQSGGDEQQPNMECLIKTTPIIPGPESNNSDTPSNNRGGTSKMNQSDSGNDSGHDSNHSSPAGSQEAVNEETPMMQSEDGVEAV